MRTATFVLLIFLTSCSGKPEPSPASPIKDGPLPEKKIDTSGPVPGMQKPDTPVHTQTTPDNTRVTPRQ